MERIIDFKQFQETLCGQRPLGDISPHQKEIWEQAMSDPSMRNCYREEMRETYMRSLLILGVRPEDAQRLSENTFGGDFTEVAVDAAYSAIRSADQRLASQRSQELGFPQSLV